MTQCVPGHLRPTPSEFNKPPPWTLLKKCNASMGSPPTVLVLATRHRQRRAGNIIGEKVYTKRVNIKEYQRYGGGDLQ